MKNNWDRIYNDLGYDYTSHNSVIRVAYRYLLGSGGQKKVLDIGCGVGKQAEYMCAKGVEIAGIDVSEEAINLAIESARKHGMQIVYMVGSASSLPYGNNSFDGVMSFRVLNHGNKSDIERYFHEIKRILKPGGSLVFSVQKIDGLRWNRVDHVCNGIPVRILDERVYMPIVGKEAGVVHFAFTRKLIKELLMDFVKVRVDLIRGKESWEKYYLVTASLPYHF